MLNFNKSRSNDDVDDGSSNIRARADSIDCGRRLLTSDGTLFVRCVIVVDDDVGDDVTTVVDTLGFFTLIHRQQKLIITQNGSKLRWNSVIKQKPQITLNENYSNAFIQKVISSQFFAHIDIKLLNDTRFSNCSFQPSRYFNLSVEKISEKVFNFRMKHCDAFWIMMNVMRVFFLFFSFRLNIAGSWEFRKNHWFLERWIHSRKHVMCSAQKMCLHIFRIPF